MDNGWTLDLLGRARHIASTDTNQQLLETQYMQRESCWKQWSSLWSNAVQTNTTHTVEEFAKSFKSTNSSNNLKHHRKMTFNSLTTATRAVTHNIYNPLFSHGQKWPHTHHIKETVRLQKLHHHDYSQFFESRQSKESSRFNATDHVTPQVPVAQKKKQQSWEF